MYIRLQKSIILQNIVSKPFDQQVPRIVARNEKNSLQYPAPRTLQIILLRTRIALHARNLGRAR